MKLTSRFIVLLISILMVMSSTIAVFAATLSGETKDYVSGDASKGNAMAGTEYNTFAAGLDLQEVFLKRNAFYTDGIGNASTPVKVLASIDSAITSIVAGDDGSVYITGDNLTADDEESFSDITWKYTYEKAAVFPDGTEHDVELIYTLDKIALGGEGTASGPSTGDKAKYSLSRFGGVQVGGSFTGVTAGKTDEEKVAYRLFVTVKMQVKDGGTYTYLVPFSGVNAGKGQGGKFKPLAQFGNDYFRENVVANNGTVYAPETVTTSSAKILNFDGNSVWGGNNVRPVATNGNSGNDRNYNAGFVVQTKNGDTFSIATMAGSNGSVDANNIFIELGDLQHRIWSGSGDNGKIETYKNGTSGAKLPGGSFDGDDVTTVTGDESTLKRYVVPDAKNDVTYVMEPTKEGYFAKEVSVDGEVKKIQMDQPEGKTWTFAAGVLTHLGGDKYKFVFNKPNATDHSIYVTWRTTPASDDATSIDGKGETQKGKPVFKPGGTESFVSGKYTLLDNGNPVDSITIDREGKYTIDKETGEVTFVPEPNFVGVATGVTVQATQTDEQTITAKYTPTVVETDQTKTVTRNVTFTYKTENGKTASKTVTQTLTFKRTGKYNKETGQVDYPDWEPQTFPAVKAPEIEGWTPNMAEAPALTVLDPNIKVADVHIVYNKIEGDEAGEGVDTGDDNNVKPWVVILLANAMAICALIISRRRRNA